MRRAGIAISIALAIALGALAIVLSKRELRLLSHNSQVIDGRFTVGVPPRGGTRCQYGVLVPRGTGNVRLFARIPPGPAVVAGPIGVTIAPRRGGPVSTGQAPRGVRTPQLLVPVSPLRATITSAAVCIVNHGRTAVDFVGAETPQQGVLHDVVHGEAAEDARAEFLTARPHSWWSFASPVAHRFALSRASFVGPWTLYAIVAAVLALWAASIATLLRRDR